MPRTRNSATGPLQPPVFRASRGGFRPNPGKIAVAYIRASTEEQALSPEAQRAAIEQWARARGFTLASVHVDQGVRGATPLEACPGLVAAIEAVRATRAAVLVVAKRDRMARDVMKACMVEALLRREGARAVSAAGEGDGEGPADQLMRTIVDAFAQYERALIAARTKAGLAVKRGRGEFCGGDAPYGYVREGAQVVDGALVGGTLVAVPVEQSVIARARELAAEGASLRSVAAQLAAEGHVSRSGRAFAPAQVARMTSSR